MAEIVEEIYRDNSIEITLELATRKDKKFIYKKSCFEVPNIGEEKIKEKSAYLESAFRHRGEIELLTVKRTGSKGIKLIIYFKGGKINEQRNNI